MGVVSKDPGAGYRPCRTSRPSLSISRRRRTQRPDRGGFTANFL